MKLCIPTTDDSGMEARVSGHFGSAPYFTLVDLDSGQLEALPNPDCHTSPGACFHVPVLTARKVDTLAVVGLGRRALAGLNEAGIDVVRAHGATVSAVLDSIHAGKAPAMSVDAACGGGRHGHGRGKGHGNCEGHGDGDGHAHRHGHGGGLGHARRGRRGGRADQSGGDTSTD
jgi:predicted Fe-Mo cluster-binding NifX family protein